MMSDINAGRIERVVTWRLDRLGRSTNGLTSLFNHLLERNVDLVSVRDGFDLKEPQGRLLANLLASIAEFENELRSQRILAGQAAAREQGKQWGGSKKGHRKAKTTAKVDAILKLHERGTSKAEISRVIGLSAPTIYDIMKSRQ